MTVCLVKIQLGPVYLFYLLMAVCSVSTYILFADDCLLGGNSIGTSLFILFADDSTLSTVINPLINSRITAKLINRELLNVYN